MFRAFGVRDWLGLRLGSSDVQVLRGAFMNLRSLGFVDPCVQGGYDHIHESKSSKSLLRWTVKSPSQAVDPAPQRQAHSCRPRPCCPSPPRRGSISAIWSCRLDWVGFEGMPGRGATMTCICGSAEGWCTVAAIAETAATSVRRRPPL